jgi:MtrB/PioB family decaheme-associated outer membrane protein
MNTATARSRSGIAGVAFAAAIAAGPLVRADQQVGDARVSGAVELGGRIVTGDTDSAKFQEYRDIDDGAFGAAHFLIEDPTQTRFLRGWLDDIGEDDQRYRLEAGQWGLWGLALEYDELPHYLSEQAQTPYLNTHANQLVLPPSFTRPPADFPATLNANLQPAKLGVMWRTGTAEAHYTPFQDVELAARYRVQDKDGTRPSALGFGSPGGRFVNHPARVDERTYELRTDATVTHETWSLGLGYTGSIYQNFTDSVTVDNPLQGIDTVGLSSRGRYTTAPDNSAHSVNLSGTSIVPAPFPVRATGTLGFGTHRQDDHFEQHTINSAIAADPLLVLPADNLEGKVATLLGNATVTARPSTHWTIDARYRFYDFDNKTDSLTFPAVVVNDQSVAAETHISTALDYQRQNAEVKAAYQISQPAAVSFSYQWDHWKRGRNREVLSTNEHGPGIDFDYLAATWLQLRTGYAFLLRDRSDYRSLAYFEQTLPPADAAAAENNSTFSSLRDFDVERRRLHKVDALAQILPLETLALTLSGAVYAANYPNADYGLEDDTAWSAGAEASWTPLDWLSFAVGYTYDYDRLAQDLRNRPGLPDDPINDYHTRIGGEAHNVTAESDVTLIPDRLSFNVGYLFQHGRDRTDSSGALGTAVDYPTVGDWLHVAHAELRYRVLEPVELRARYAYEKWYHEDFRYDGLRPSTPSVSATDIFLGDEVDDYQAHVISLSAVVEF